MRKTSLGLFDKVATKILNALITNMPHDWCQQYSWCPIICTCYEPFSVKKLKQTRRLDICGLSVRKRFLSIRRYSLECRCVVIERHNFNQSNLTSTCRSSSFLLLPVGIAEPQKQSIGNNCDLAGQLPKPEAPWQRKCEPCLSLPRWSLGNCRKLDTTADEDLCIFIL